jgi:AcrR family transcriptional regulator
MPRQSDTKARIERVAATLFAAKGVETTTTKEIAAGVGISEGAIYRHFTGKDALIRHLFSTNNAALAGALDAILEVTDDLTRRIELAVKLFCGTFDEDPEMFRFILLSRHDRPESDIEGTDNLETSLRRMFQDGIDAGECRCADADLLTGIALGIVLQSALFIIHGRLEAPMMRLSPALTDAIRKAVMLEPDPAIESVGQVRGG